MITNEKHTITIGHYHGDDELSLLICENPQILFVLNRFEIKLGFADKTIEEVCTENHVNVNTFLAVINMLLCGDKSEHIDYSEIDPLALVRYLKNSHSNYLEYRLPKIQDNIREFSGSIPSDMMNLIIRYFEGYLTEVRKHLSYEEEVVFPYVSKLLNHEDVEDYCIDIFCKKHDNIDLKLKELKDIVIKYINTPSTNEIVDLLNSIFTCSDDLYYHNIIEDHLFVPVIKYMENKDL